jgi:cytoskeletal protein CcmA (bactofilin family)
MAGKNDSAELQRDRLAWGAGQQERRVAAWIGPSIRIKGDLTSSEDLTIAGRINGDVSVPEHAVVIAKGAGIRGNILARAVVVYGEVIGTVTASGRVEIGDTGTVEGDINTPRMAISEGGMLHGRLSISASRAAPPGLTGTTPGGTTGSSA